MKKRIAAFLLVLVLVVPCALASAETYYRLKNTVKLRYLPDYNARVLDTYRADWAFTIDKKVDATWASVTFTNGKSGYTERKQFAYTKSYTAWVTKDNTKLYRGPGYGFSSVGTLNRGNKVTVLTHGSAYDYVKFSDGYGYIANSVLSKKSVKASQQAKQSKTNYTAWVVSSGGTVGLRSSASGANSAVFANILPGTQITVLEEGKEFHYVSVDGTEGYMRSKYISRNEPAPVPVTTPIPAFEPYTTTSRTASDGTSPRLFLGEGLGWSSDIIPVGATVDVLSRGKDPYWYRVSVNGKTGYMPSKYLD